MFFKFLKITIPAIFLAITLYFSCFKSVMVVSYQRTEGCGESTDTSGSVLVSHEGQVRDIAGIGLPVAAAAPPLSGKALELAANEPKLIKSFYCLNASQCQIWERPGTTPTTITMLVGGPSYDAMYFKSLATGTQLDEAQSYLNLRGVNGVAVALEEPAPSCLSLGIVDISYSHILRWKWSSL